MIKQVLTLFFRARGWKFVNNVSEDVRSFVMLGAPHTSNHDFIPAMAVANLMKRNPKFVIKSEWLKFPLNILLIPMGAVGIDRKQLRDKDRLNYTDMMAALFKEIPELALMIAPEGTRGPNAKWKTGFYYIAQKAGVPIVLAYADYAKKEAGLGKVIWPTNFEEDMKIIREFYQHVSGKRPEKFKLDEKR